MECIHGLGIGHLAVDIMMAVPAIGTVILYCKCKFKRRTKDESK